MEYIKTVSIDFMAIIVLITIYTLIAIDLIKGKTLTPIDKLVLYITGIIIIVHTTATITQLFL